MMESSIFHWTNLYILFQLWPSSFNVSLVSFSNLFGVKVRISNLSNAEKVTIREFLWKRTEMESDDYFLNKALDNRAIVDT